MKSKFLSFVAFAACLLMGFTSCSDNDDHSTGSDTEMADYTVIYWGSAGAQEGWTLCDLTDLIVKREEGSITNKVNLVGCFDPTMKYSQALVAKNFGGTIEFELGTKRNTSADTLSAFKNAAGVENGFRLQEIEDKLDSTTVNPYSVELYSKIFSSMKSCEANSKYDIYSSESLAQYIAKAAKEHPAKNYILLFYGHGVGYVPCEGFDGDPTAISRSCISSTDGLERRLSLNDVTRAITASGVKIKTVFYQCCQMAALENLASMQHCTDYVVASAEQTISGYIPQFIADLSAVGGTEEGLKTACKKSVDFYAKDCVGDSRLIKHLSSQGFYDLSMTQTLLQHVRDAATWFASAAKTNPQFMNDVVFGGVEVMSMDMTEINPELTYATSHDLQSFMHKALKGSKLTLEKQENVPLMIQNLATANKSAVFGICFASIMEKALSDDLAAEAVGLDRKELSNIYNGYMNTLKQMAYIRGNGLEAVDPVDAVYRYASPSVNLFSMNEQGYHANIVNYIKDFGYQTAKMKISDEICKYLSAGDNEGAFKKFANIVNFSLLAIISPSLAETKAFYQSTDFDKFTGWSHVMENINVNPMLLINPTRYDVTCAEKNKD